METLVDMIRPPLPRHLPDRPDAHRETENSTLLHMALPQLASACRLRTPATGAIPHSDTTLFSPTTLHATAVTPGSMVPFIRPARTSPANPHTRGRQRQGRAITLKVHTSCL